MFDRAQRRHYDQVVKKRSRRISRDNWGYTISKYPNVEDIYKKNEKLANNLKSCTHVFCCNPRRKLNEKTIKERDIERETRYYNQYKKI